MRLINADKLRRKAQKVAIEAWKMNLTAKVETILTQFIDWIDESPTISIIEEGWILCSKQLPKETKTTGHGLCNVLVTIKIDNKLFVEQVFFLNNNFYTKTDGKQIFPIAWKPMPDPYEG